MSQREGFALLYALFMVMALSLIGLGVMATGVRESAIAGALERHGRARARAEGAALEAVARWSTRSHSLEAVGSERELPLSPAWAGTAVAVTRLDSTLYLLRADAREPPAAHATGPLTPVARARAGLLVRTLSPAALGAAFPAALTATRLIELTGGRVSGESSCQPPGRTAPAQGAPAPAALAPEVVVRPEAEVTGTPAVSESTPPAALEPDPFSLELAPAVADLVYTRTSVIPRPVVTAGLCAADDRNWGAIDPAHPCHTLLPFIHATRSLRIIGGQGRGVLVVDGDAHFTDGARFEGVLLVRGRLILDGESRIEGAVRAGTALILNGQVRRNDCAIAAALSAPALDRAFRPPGRWWIPVFQEP